MSWRDETIAKPYDLNRHREEGGDSSAGLFDIRTGIGQTGGGVRCGRR